MAKTINVDALQRVSVQYDPVLRMLPFTQLKPRLAEMGIRFISSSKELREVSFERRGGIARPLAAGVEDPDDISEIGKVKEAKLVPEWGYTQNIEDIMNYEDVNVIGNTPEDVNPETKRHPQELLIIQTNINTVGEDLLDAVYFAERDEEDASPYGLFDGINTKVDTLISASEITEAIGNLVPTGSIIAPTDDEDTDAYDKLVTFLRASHNQLKKGAILKLTQNVYYYALDALANKLKYKGVMSYDMLLNALQGDSNFTGLIISVEPEMGTGDRIYLTKPQNFDFSLWTDSATQFVQVRNPFKNPNLVQYWMQWKAGARVRQHHPKVFQMNDGTAAASQLSGDYLS